MDVLCIEQFHSSQTTLPESNVQTIVEIFTEKKRIKLIYGPPTL